MDQDQMYLRLETERGELLHDTHVPCRHRSDLPKSIAWAGRMFHLREDTEVADPRGGFAACYREGKHLDLAQPNAESGNDGITVLRGPTPG